MSFLHIETIIRQVQQDQKSYWNALLVKLKEQHPNLSFDDIVLRLIPPVTYSFLIMRDQTKDHVCTMPCRLIKSTGNNKVFDVDLAFETAIQDVFDVKRGLKVVAMQNNDPKDLSMNFISAANAQQIDAILKDFAQQHEQSQS